MQCHREIHSRHTDYLSLAVCRIVVSKPEIFQLCDLDGQAVMDASDALRCWIPRALGVVVDPVASWGTSLVDHARIMVLRIEAREGKRWLMGQARARVSTRTATSENAKVHERRWNGSDYELHGHGSLCTILYQVPVPVPVNFSMQKNHETARPTYDHHAGHSWR